jgi:hypothetical protein
MTLSPTFSIAEVPPPPGYVERRVDEAEMLELVERRQRANRRGDRAALDATYEGIHGRDNSLERADHERVSYYDWYLNRIERVLGVDVDIESVHVVPMYDDISRLPFKYNVTWPHPPEFELEIATADGRVSWFVGRTFRDGVLRVVLPNMVHAPWNEPILEDRGGEVEFNAPVFAKELAFRLGLEFKYWSFLLRGLVEIRAFALLVDPFYGAIHPSLLTDRESDALETYGKWAIGDWRLHSFTTTPHSNWPYGEELGDHIARYASEKPHEYKHPVFDHSVQPREDFEILIACAKAVQEAEFLSNLERFDLSDDFELGVFHINDETHACNFVLEANQDLSLLVHTPER